MRLNEIDRGDTLGHRALIGFISLVSGMRLPDAARVAFYHQDFLGGTLGGWTQATMRGPSEWRIGERELMAALVAKWNSCAFCTAAHSAIATKDLDPVFVQGAMVDFDGADMHPPMKAMLRFLRKMTLEPAALTGGDARSVLDAGVTKQGLEDGIAVGALFNIVTRYADALAFAMPTSEEFDKAAVMLLKRGYS
jgi:uncharacterized peroxidase-related enzyme